VGGGEERWWRCGIWGAERLTRKNLPFSIKKKTLKWEVDLLARTRILCRSKSFSARLLSGEGWEGEPLGDGHRVAESLGTPIYLWPRAFGTKKCAQKKRKKPAGGRERDSWRRAGRAVRGGESWREILKKKKTQGRKREIQTIAWLIKREKKTKLSRETSQRMDCFDGIVEEEKGKAKKKAQER